MLLWLAACTEPPAAPAPLALAGTRWSYEELDGAEADAWEFDADGTLFVATGNNPAPDTWTFDGATLHVKINDYATYEGRLTAQGGFVGTASNPAGTSWDWLLVRDRPPALDGCGDAGPFDVTDTRWRVFTKGSPRASDTVFFLKGGRYSARNEPARDADSWTQQGDALTWTAGAACTGTLVGDHTIVGTSTDATGAHQRVRLWREPLPGECL